MGKLLTAITLLVFLNQNFAQQTFPLQMEGEYLCEIRSGCSTPYKVLIGRDTNNANNFIFIDSCPNPNIFERVFNVGMLANAALHPDSFVGTASAFTCAFYGRFFPNSDSLYVFRATLGCGSGCTCLLEYKCKKVIPVGLGVNKLQKLQLAPNPVSKLLNVKYFDGRLNYSIYNSLGALAQSGQLTETNTHIEVLNLPKGIYFIQFEQDNVQYTQKFVKE